jgi:hypothetical protein
MGKSALSPAWGKQIATIRTTPYWGGSDSVSWGGGGAWTGGVTWRRGGGALRAKRERSDLGQSHEGGRFFLSNPCADCARCVNFCPPELIA